MGDDGCGCGVSDADFTEADVVGCDVLADLGSVGSLPVNVLVAGHRRADAEVDGAVRDATVDEVGVIDRVTCDASVDDLNRDVEGIGDDDGGSSAGEEVENHLASYFAGIRGDVLRRDAMVGAEDDELTRGHARCERALEGCDLGGEFFETAERTDRFGLGVDGSLEVVREGWRWGRHLSRLMGVSRVIDLLLSAHLVTSCWKSVRGAR